MRLIPLTQGQFAKVADEDFSRLNSEKWYAHWSKFTKSFYARRNVPHSRGHGQTSFYMHHAVLGALPSSLIDHLNHDTLDNQGLNLRLSDKTKNALNRKGANSGTKSGVRGVSWNKSCGKWQSEIVVSGKRKYLGVFDTIESAAKAYADCGGSR